MAVTTNNSWILSAQRYGRMLASPVLMGKGKQNFLGSRLIRIFLLSLPKRLRRAAALRIIDLSPHYFFRSNETARLRWSDFLEREVRRNAEARQILIDKVVAPSLGGEKVALDYGCGPGFLSRAASPHVKRIYSCDISAGVIACAEQLTGAENVEYILLRNGRIPLENESVDVIFTFSVIQHVTDEIFGSILREWRRVLRPGGVAICQVQIGNPDGRWHTQADWENDKSLRGRVKWEIGIHSFWRTEDATKRLVEDAGLKLKSSTLIGDIAPELRDDLASQHVCFLSLAG